LTDDFSLKFVIFALNDIREAVVNLKFYGLRPTFNFKKKEKFDRINYEMFRHLDLEMPDRLAHLCKRKKKRQFRMLYNSNKQPQDQVKELDGNDENKATLAEESTDLTVLKKPGENSVRLPEIV
jgi:hypothetical protein